MLLYARDSCRLWLQHSEIICLRFHGRNISRRVTLWTELSLFVVLCWSDGNVLITSDDLDIVR